MLHAIVNSKKTKTTN